MVRELLFRGRDKDIGDWRYGGVCDYDSGVSIFEVEHFDGSWTEPPSTDLNEYDVEPETVGQFTGLTDMKNQKIFEGDILKAEINTQPKWNSKLKNYEPQKRTRTYWVVEYHDHETESGFMTYGIDRRWHRPLTRSRIINAHAVVVGNIHDNPELMKKELQKICTM